MKTTTFKNLFLIASFFLLSTISYGQTEEETISWLTEKFNKSLKGSDYYKKITKIEVSPCEVKINLNTGSGADQDWVIYIPTDGVILTDEELKYKEERIVVKNLNNNRLSFSAKHLYFVKLNSTETDLYARIKKALDHLATFCPKKKETF